MNGASPLTAPPRTRAQRSAALPGSVILHGTLGRSRGAAARAAVAPRRRATAELAGWDLRHGRAWSRALENVAHRAAAAGIPVRAGTPELLRFAALHEWGWSGPVPAEFLASPGSGEACASPDPRWVLRVPFGAAGTVRAWLEEELASVDVAGAPSVLVEESPLAFLPAPPAGDWPGAESWRHAAVRLGTEAPGCTPFVPRNAQGLLTHLREGDAATGRRPVADDRAALLAWDMWCAACAWERDPAAWWLTSRPVTASLPRVRSAWAHAEARGIRVLAPCVNRSVRCASVEAAHERATGASAVRLGLDELGAALAAAAPALVAERVRGGAYRSRADLLVRARRAGVSWRALGGLLVSGACEALPWTAGPLAESVRRRFAVVFPGTERRAACRLSCLTP